MRSTTAVMVVAVTLLAVGGAQASLIWHTAFDDSALVPGPIVQSIPSDVLDLEIVQLRYFTVDGRSAELDIAAGLTSLRDVFNQSWLWTGFETDNYKPVSVSTGANTTTLFLTDDNDVWLPVGPTSRQTDQPGTPNGIFCLGYTDGAGFADAGSTEYFYGNMVCRLDVGVVPEPTTCALMLLAGLGALHARKRT